MTRVLSGVQPSGAMHLGNYLGAFRAWVDDQYCHDAYFCVVDLHALTSDQDPELLGRRTLDTAAGLLACGLDPQVCTVFVQSHVPEHPRLTWLLECTAAMGELRRMTQFKEKVGRGAFSDELGDGAPGDGAPGDDAPGPAAADGRGRDGRDRTSGARVGLFTYPLLMAADILLYDADRVPVGDDQRQHLELTRNLAIRFNHRYGATFVVPDAAVPSVGARVMDLQEPTRKMSKSVESPQGTVLVQDPPEVVRRKVRRAVTDTDGHVVFDPVTKPGVSNLLELLGAAIGQAPAELADGFTGYGQLKDTVADALVELLRPVQQRYEEVSADPGELTRLLAAGAANAGEVASSTYRRAASRIGLLAP